MVVHFNRSKVFLLCFYDSYDISLREKTLANVIVEFHHFTEAVIGRRWHSAEKVFETPLLECHCRASVLQFY